jgi:hypothetical protein
MDVENGTGLPNAESYASVNDGDEYHEGHLYPVKWTSATTAQKTAALIMATRLIDANCRFIGYRKTTAQALQWPRSQAPDVEAAVVRNPLGPAYTSTVYLPDNAVPKCVIQATCEQARALLVEDRTANPLGEGLKSSDVDNSKFVFDKSDRKPVVSRVAMALMRRVLVGGLGQARVIRA